jgi:Holliday junction resolvasome RuvABC endonuclease subunit
MATHFIGIDTATQNTGVAVVDEGGRTLRLGKPEPVNSGDDRLFFDVEYVTNVIMAYEGEGSQVVLAMEDYIITGFSKAYHTAMLVGMLKLTCHLHQIGYCAVHPAKTAKYVVKRRTVEKAERIEYWCTRLTKEQVTTASDLCKALRANPKGDLADALSIAHVGRLAYLNRKGRCTQMEDRWAEILWEGDGGLLVKPGSVHFLD